MTVAVLYMLDSCGWWTPHTVPPTSALVDYLPGRQTGRLLTALVIDSSETRRADFAYPWGNRGAAARAVASRSCPL